MYTYHIAHSTLFNKLYAIKVFISRYQGGGGGGGACISFPIPWHIPVFLLLYPLFSRAEKYASILSSTDLLFPFSTVRVIPPLPRPLTLAVFHCSLLISPFLYYNNLPPSFLIINHLHRYPATPFCYPAQMVFLPVLLLYFPLSLALTTLPAGLPPVVAPSSSSPPHARHARNPQPEVVTSSLRPSMLYDSLASCL